MASIQKRGKTYQYTVSRMENGKPKPIRKGGFRSKKDARIAAAEVELQLGKGIIPHLRPVPIDKYFERWIQLYKSHLSETTQKHYNYTLKAIKTHFGSRPLQEITRHDYQFFLNEYGNNRSKETLEKLNSHIRACVKDAIEEQIINNDFTRKAVLSWKIPPKHSTDKLLNYSDSELLLTEIMKKRNESLVFSLLLLALTSGMRFGELVGLTWSDFDFNNNTITINKTWGYMKRNLDGFCPTKNEYSIRTIKMNELTMNHFYILSQFNKRNKHQLVFYYPNSKYRVLGNSLVNKQLRELLKGLRIKPITVHGLRHTHASLLLSKKVSIQYVSKRLGHSNIETTLNKYAHLIEELYQEDEQRTVDVFNGVITK